MENRTFTIPNISCSHCTRTIENELGELTGVTSVQADAGTKKVTVAWQAPATLASILATLGQINYPAADA